VKTHLLLEAPTRSDALMGAGDFGLAESSVIHFLLCEGLEICERLILAMVFLVKRFRDHLYIFRGDLTA
jgi:hypothetical protein